MQKIKTVDEFLIKLKNTHDMLEENGNKNKIALFLQICAYKYAQKN